MQQIEIDSVYSHILKCIFITKNKSLETCKTLDPLTGRKIVQHRLKILPISYWEYETRAVRILSGTSFGMRTGFGQSGPIENPPEEVRPDLVQRSPSASNKLTRPSVLNEVWFGPSEFHVFRKVSGSEILIR